MLGVLLSLVWAVFSPLCFLSDVTLFYRKCHFVLALLCQVFAASHGFSLAVSRVCSSAAECGLLLLWSTGSRHVGCSNCGPLAQLPHGIWNLPGPPDIKPMSSALAGGFFSTGPPGKSSAVFFFFFFFLNCSIGHSQCCVSFWYIAN